MRDAGIAALAGMGLALQLMLFGVVLLVLKFIWGKLRNKIGKTRDSKLDAKGKVKKENLVEETLYEQALNELDNGDECRGIWAKALAKSNGSDSHARSKYLELRVEFLKDEAHVIQSNFVSEESNPDLIEVEKSEASGFIIAVRFWFISISLTFLLGYVSVETLRDGNDQYLLQIAGFLISLVPAYKIAFRGVSWQRKKSAFYFLRVIPVVAWIAFIILAGNGLI
jgi:hypothetical protein